MKRKEMREVTIIYCDYCNEEVKGNFHTIYKKDKSQLHFCSITKKGEKHDCLVNWKKKQISNKVNAL